MSFTEVSFLTNRDNVDKYSGYLSKLGSTAITVSEPDELDVVEIFGEPGMEKEELELWEISKVTGLFKDHEDLNLLEFQIKYLLDEKSLESLEIRDVADSDWQTSWREHFKPISFNNKITICPSWCEPIANQINIILDPGMAFGTGNHPTTAMCVDYLAKADLQDKTVLDFGCGSGILGLAAAKLGASNVVLTDCCPDAITACKTNFTNNNVSAESFIVELPENMPEVKAEITVANILANPLIELCETLAQNTKSGGKIALSGILNRQANEVVARFSEFFTDFNIENCDNWVLISGTRL